MKVYGKTFAMVSSSGELVVKLPKGRVDALVSSAVGERFDADRVRPMKEWLEVRSQSGTGPCLAAVRPLAIDSRQHEPVAAPVLSR